MKNRNTKFTAILFVLAFALASIVQARPGPSPGPTHPPANDGVSANSEANSAYSTSSEGENLPVVTIHSTGDISRAYIGQYGYGTILVTTLPDPRAFNRQAYSVVITLEPGLGYALGIPSSATMWIKP